MTVVELRDREALGRFFRRRAGVHAYELGDLDDFFWPHTRWLARQEDGELQEVILVYDEPDPPVLIALADDVGAMSALLHDVAGELPPAVYAHLSPELVAALAPRLVPVHEPAAHRKLTLVDPDSVRAYDRPEAALLDVGDLAEVTSFYQRAYPGTWFQARMLETGRYVGIRMDGELLCVAGVHVWSPAYGVAALGNVATAPEARGQGLGTAACARLCRILHDDGIDVISLNVRADNAAAIRSYEKLGFVHAADYVEVPLGAGV